MTENPKGPQGLWQREGESNLEYCRRLCREIQELSN